MNPYEWREVFAWLPVRLIDGKWVWLKRVLAKRNYYQPHKAQFVKF